jgi:hypothetical protein
MAVRKGWRGYVRIADSTANLGSAPDPKLNSAPFDMDNANEVIVVIGSRNPSEIVEGNITISGSLERNFDGGNCAYYSISSIRMDQMCGLGQTNVSEFVMKIAPNGSGSAPEFYIRGVKFSGYSLGLTADGITVESCDWQGTNVSTA